MNLRKKQVFTALHAENKPSNLRKTIVNSKRLVFCTVVLGPGPTLLTICRPSGSRTVNHYKRVYRYRFGATVKFPQADLSLPIRPHRRG